MKSRDILVFKAQCCLWPDSYHEMWTTHHPFPRASNPMSVRRPHRDRDHCLHTDKQHSLQRPPFTVCPARSFLPFRRAPVCPLIMRCGQTPPLFPLLRLPYNRQLNGQNSNKASQTSAFVVIREVFGLGNSWRLSPPKNLRPST